MKKLLLLLFLIPNLVMAENMEWESYCNFLAIFHNTFKDKINKDMASNGAKVSMKNYSCDSSSQKIIANYSLHKKYFKDSYKKKWKAALHQEGKRQMTTYFCGLARANKLTAKEKHLFVLKFLTMSPNAFGNAMARKFQKLLDVDLSDSFYQVKIYRRNKILSDFTNAFGDCSLNLSPADEKFLREMGIR